MGEPSRQFGVYTQFTRLPKGSSFPSASIDRAGPCRFFAIVCVRFNAVQYRFGTLNSVMIAVLFGSSKGYPVGDAGALGHRNLLKMSVGRILFLLALAPAANAQLPHAQPLSADPDELLLGLPHSMRLELGLTPLGGSLAGTHSSVFTADYWARAYAEKAQLENHFGVHLAMGALLQPALVRQTPVPGHPQFNFVQEWRWPGGPLTGLQFERKNFLFQGDRLSIRATSDVQTLFRGVGLSGSETAVDMLSLLGWRSHSRLVWQLGEPKRELQWQFSAGVDRRAAVESSSVNLQVLRRF
jgi:hypothetical protein